MLNFFKKPSRVINRNVSCPNQLANRNQILNDEAVLDESVIDDDKDEITIECKSRLSMNLIEIIADKNCLIYFVQFLETKNSLQLIKFYLDAECFKTATEQVTKPNENEVLLTHQNNDVEQKNSSNDCDHLKTTTVRRKYMNADDEANIVVPELKTLCDLSMRKPLTDDEKSLIYAETNKQHDLKKSPPTNNSKLTEENEEESVAEPILKQKFSSSIIATEAIRIYRKYLNTNSSYFIDLPATIQLAISLELCSQQTNQGISSTCFNEAQMYIIQLLENEYLNEFLESSYYCKYIVEVLMDVKNLKLSDILHSESALFYFMEYLEQENQRYLLEFWMAAMNFRKHYLLTQKTYDNIEDSDANGNKCTSYNHTEAQDDAMIIYEKYFSLQAQCRLKISDKMRSSIEEKICNDKKDGKLMLAKCFDQPLKIIENYIEKNHFQNFISCQLFANYSNELKLKVQNQKLLKPKKLLRQLHSSSYESIENLSGSTNFISQQNTYLAMESSTHATRIKKDKSTDMQIDSRYLTDPDSLWQRDKNLNNGSLSFGRVNSLGRYERDFDLRCKPSDEKWSFLSGGGNKIKNAMRKFVNLPEDKVQEEIAWQMAEMIVKDVTSITLGNTATDISN